MRSATAPRKRSASISASVSASGSWISSETRMIRTLLRSASPKARGLEHEAVVVEADPVGRPAEAVPVEAAVPGGLADRQHHEKREQQQRRRQEQHEDREPAVAGRQRRRAAATAKIARSVVQRRRAGRTPRHASVALLPGGLDRLRGLLRRHAAAGDLRRDVVDDAPDRRTERLVVEVLVIVRARDVLRRCCAGSACRCRPPRP